MIAFADYFSSCFRSLGASETQNEIGSSKNQARNTDIEAKVNRGRKTKLTRFFSRYHSIKKKIAPEFLVGREALAQSLWYFQVKDIDQPSKTKLLCHLS